MRKKANQPVCEEDIGKELQNPARKNYIHRRATVRSFEETQQTDPVDPSNYLEFNKKYSYTLTVINIFSEFAWAVLVKRKDQNVATGAMKSIFDGGVIPKSSVWTIVKNFERTLREKTWKKFGHSNL